MALLLSSFQKELREDRNVHKRWNKKVYNNVIFDTMQEIIFVVKESEEGGYIASALNESIVTDGYTLQELKTNVKEAVLCHFDDDTSKIIRLHMVREEVFSV